MTSTLRRGDHSNSVRALQQALNARGAQLAVDGKFGAKTAAAVSRFQSAHGLAASGVAATATLAALGLRDTFAPTALRHGAGAGQFPRIAAQPMGANPSLNGLNQVWSSPQAGVTLTTLSGSSAALGQQRMHAAIVDVAKPDLRVRMTKAGEGAKTVSAWAKKTGAIVALNGDFFDMRFKTLGYAKAEGQTVGSKAESAARTSIAFDANDRATVDGENTINPALASAVSVVGGAKEVLLKNGASRGGPEHAGQRQPRSAVGVTAEGKVIFLAAEGRTSLARGLTFLETAEVMRSLGAVDAVMLDGGGSTSLVVDGVRLNQPSDGVERPVASHIGVIAA